MSQEEEWMRLALQLSRRALPRCLPNPPVGCVLVADGHVVASGYTQEPGNMHAEPAAISDLESATPGMTAFVTLEPCSFEGRTPACTDALIEARVAAVHVSLVDPDPRNSGRGLELLRRAGIDVHLGLLADEVGPFLRPFLTSGCQDSEPGQKPVDLDAD